MSAIPKLLLAMSSSDDRRTVRDETPAEVEVIEADNCEHARQLLSETPAIGVIVTDLTLCDGNWWCLYREAVERANPAEMIVVLPRPGLDASTIQAHDVTVVSRPFELSQLADAVRRALLVGQKSIER